jgi:hypothetical protein
MPIVFIQPLRCRSVLVPNCPGAEVSSIHKEE